MSETIRNEHLEQVSLPVQGMSCAACVGKVEKAVKGMPGVTSVVVNLPAESAKVTFYPGTVDKARIKKEIQAGGKTSRFSGHGRHDQ